MVFHKRFLALSCGLVGLSVVLYASLVPDRLHLLSASELAAIHGGCCACQANGCIPVNCLPLGLQWTEAAANPNFGVQGGLAKGAETCTPGAALPCTRLWTCVLPNCINCNAGNWAQAVAFCNEAGDCPES